MTKPAPTTDLGTDGPFAARPPTPIAIRSQLEPGDFGTVVRLHSREGVEHGASFEAEVAHGVADLTIAWTRSPDAGRLWLAGPQGPNALTKYERFGAPNGEGGIRTLDGRNRPYRFSRPAHSTTLPPLPVAEDTLADDQRLAPR